MRFFRVLKFVHKFRVFVSVKVKWYPRTTVNYHVEQKIRKNERLSIKRLKTIKRKQQ